MTETRQPEAEITRCQMGNTAAVSEPPCPREATHPSGMPNRGYCAEHARVVELIGEYDRWSLAANMASRWVEEAREAGGFAHADLVRLAEGVRDECVRQTVLSETRRQEASRAADGDPTPYSGVEGETAKGQGLCRIGSKTDKPCPLPATEPTDWRGKPEICRAHFLEGRLRELAEEMEEISDELGRLARGG